MKHLILILTSFLWSGLANSNTPPPGLSSEQKQLIINTLKQGTFSARWHDGEAVVRDTAREFYKISEPNHEKVYENFDPIGLFYNFTSAYSQPAEDLMATGDPVSALEANLVQFTRFLKPFWPWAQTDRDVFPDLARVAVGIYYQADVVRGVTTGKSEQLRDIQLFTVNRIFQTIETNTVDPSISIIVLKYLRARRSGYPAALLYDVANSLYQTAVQTYGEYEVSKTGEMKKKTPYESGEKRNCESLQIMAANYFAMAGLSSSEPAEFSFLSPEMAKVGAINQALSLADQLNLPRISKKVIPAAIKIAKADGDQSKISDLEEKLISYSPEVIAHKNIFDRFCIRVRQAQLKWGGILVSAYSFLLAILFFWRSWQLGTSKSQRFKLAQFLERTARGTNELRKRFFQRGNLSLSLLDRTILGSLAFGIGSILPVIKERADFLMQALVGVR